MHRVLIHFCMAKLGPLAPRAVHFLAAVSYGTNALYRRAFLHFVSTGKIPARGGYLNVRMPCGQNLSSLGQR